MMPAPLRSTLFPTGRSSDLRHFLIEQDEITHDHRLVSDLLEGRVRSESEPSLDRNTLHADREVSSRHANAEDLPWLQLARLAERLLYHLPIGIGGVRRDRPGNDRDNDHHCRSECVTTSGD